MAEGFRDYFVGEKGYDALKKLMKNGNDFCIDVAKCLQERNDAEVAYVRALRKNSDVLQKLAGRAKGTLAQACTTLATQTNKESDAHSVIAGTLLNDISIPMKNLAETQSKERKSIEDTLDKKFKEWNAQKVIDNKYRSRQFEKSREIESLANKISELSSTTKSSVKSKTSSVSAPLVSCVLPGGRHSSVSEKLETASREATDELEKADRKYHTSTKDVEFARQACDIEMYRSCDQMQKMELYRITEMANFIRIYGSSIQTLSETMYQVSQDLYSINVVPDNDIIVQARSNVQPSEVEILLYDIYAESENNVMSEQRRILSLMSWMETLKRDIEIQEQQTKNASFSSLSSAPPHKSNEDDLPDDDGAMCSKSSPSKTDFVVNAGCHRDGSSSSSNDDDGAMYRGKRDKKNNEGVKGVSSGMFIDRRGAVLLQELYKASLYKIELVYNRIKHLSEPQYKHAQCFARTFNDKGYPTTFLRLPSQSLTHTPPSAPSAMNCFVRTMPIYDPTNMPQQKSMASTVQRRAPPVGFAAVNDVRLERTAPDDQMGPPYPVSMAQPPAKFVRALYSFKATHKDELDLEPGDNIILIERRKDGWFKGNLNGKIGLFPGNHVEEI